MIFFFLILAIDPKEQLLCALCTDIFNTTYYFQIYNYGLNTANTIAFELKNNKLECILNSIGPTRNASLTKDEGCLTFKIQSKTYFNAFSNYILKWTKDTTTNQYERLASLNITSCFVDGQDLKIGPIFRLIKLYALSEDKNSVYQLDCDDNQCQVYHSVSYFIFKVIYFYDLNF